MDTKTISFGETALDKLLQWLRSTGEPKDIDEVLERYLEILKGMVTEDQE